MSKKKTTKLIKKSTKGRGPGQHPAGICSIVNGLSSLVAFLN